MQNLSAPFIFQKECRMKIEYVLFPSVFFSKLRIRVLEGHFQCVHTIRLLEPTKIGLLKTDRVNGPLHNAISLQLVSQRWKKESIASCRGSLKRCNLGLQLALVSKNL